MVPPKLRDCGARSTPAGSPDLGVWQAHMYPSPSLPLSNLSYLNGGTGDEWGPGEVTPIGPELGAPHSESPCWAVVHPDPSL